MSEECCYPWDNCNSRRLIEFDMNKLSASEPKKSSDWLYTFMYIVFSLSITIALTAEFSMLHMTTNASTVFSGCIGMMIYTALWIWLLSKKDGYS